MTKRATTDPSEPSSLDALRGLRGALRLEKLGMTRRGKSGLAEARERLKLKRNADIDAVIAAVEAEIRRRETKS